MKAPNVIAVPDQPEQPDSGKYIEIRRKQSDGTWKIFRDIVNSEGPAVPAASQTKK